MSSVLAPFLVVSPTVFCKLHTLNNFGFLPICYERKLNTNIILLVL